MRWFLPLLWGAAGDGVGEPGRPHSLAQQGTRQSVMERLRSRHKLQHEIKQRAGSRAKGRVNAVEGTFQHKSNPTPAPTENPTPVPTPVDIRTLMAMVYDKIQDDFDIHARDLNLHGQKSSLRYQQAVQSLQLATQAQFQGIAQLTKTLQNTATQFDRLKQLGTVLKNSAKGNIENTENKIRTVEDESWAMVESAMKRYGPYLKAIDSTAETLTDYQDSAKEELLAEHRLYESDMAALMKRGFENEKMMWERFQKAEKRDEDTSKDTVEELWKGVDTEAGTQERDMGRLKGKFEKRETQITDAKKSLDDDEADAEDQADEFFAKDADEDYAEFGKSFDKRKAEITKLYALANKEQASNVANVDKVESADETVFKREEKARSSSLVKAFSTGAKEFDKATGVIKDVDINSMAGRFNEMKEAFDTKVADTKNEFAGGEESEKSLVSKFNKADMDWRGLNSDDIDVDGFVTAEIKKKGDEALKTEEGKLKINSDSDGMANGDVNGEPSMVSFRRELKNLVGTNSDSGNDVGTPGIFQEFKDMKGDGAATVEQWRQIHDNYISNLETEDAKLKQVKTAGGVYQVKALKAVTGSEEAEDEQSSQRWEAEDDKIDEMEEATGTGLVHTMKQDAKDEVARILALGRKGGGKQEQITNKMVQEKGNLDALKNSLIGESSEVNAKLNQLLKLTHSTQVNVGTALAAKVPSFGNKVQAEVRESDSSVDAVEAEVEDGSEALLQKAAQEELEQSVKAKTDIDKRTLITSDDVRKDQNEMKKAMGGAKVKTDAVMDDTFALYGTQDTKVEATVKEAKTLSKEATQSGRAYKASLAEAARTSVRDFENTYPAANVFQKLLLSGEAAEDSKLKSAYGDTNRQIEKVLDDFREKGIEAFVDVGDKIASDHKHISNKAVGVRKDYLRRFTEFLTKVHILAARMKGFAADQGEWHKKLQDEVSDEAALAGREMMLSAANVVEQQAMVESKFRSLQDVVNEDVKGVSGPMQSMIKKLADEAKAETYRILNNAELSKEEKAERLKMVDKWMKDQMMNLGDIEHNLGVDLLNAEEEIDAFSGEAQKRVGGLHSMMAERDSAQGLEQDRDNMEHTAKGLEEILQHSKGLVTQMNGEVDNRLTDEEHKHTRSSSQVNEQLQADRSVLSQVLKDAQDQVDESMDDSQTKLGEHAQAMLNSETKVEAIKQEAGGLLSSTTIQVQDLSKQVMSELESATEERRGYEKRVATLMRTLTLFMLSPLQQSKNFFEGQAAKHSEFAQQYADVMEGDGMKLLHAVGKADKDLDLALGKEKESLEWAANWEKHSDAWEDQVEAAVGKLGEKMGVAVGAAASGLHGFESGADADAQREADIAAGRIADALAAENGAAEATAGAQTDALGRLADAQAAKDREAAAEIANEAKDAEGHAEHTALATAQLAGYGDELRAQLTVAGQRAQAAAGAEQELQQAAAADAQEAKNALQNRLAALGMSTLEIGARADAAFGPSAMRAESLAERVNAEVLEEHDQLAAKHELLQSKIAVLEQEADAKHLLG